MNPKKILISRIFPEIGANILRDAGFSITTWNKNRPMTQEELIERTKDHNALYCSLTDNIDKLFLNKCSHLDIISQFAVGYDNIDISEATRLGIPIGNTPDTLNDATADVAFGLMITTARNMFYSHKSIIEGQWGAFNPVGNLGFELKNKTLGIFGLGRIGIEMAKRCKGAYNMKILYHNRKSNHDAEQELNATLVSFETLLAQSDIISVHCSLNETTKEVFDYNAFSQMKPTSIFINTARGLIHNELDLINALNNGLIWGAGLDVTNPEPMLPNNPLLQMVNVAILPHIGSATKEARDGMATIAANNIINYYKGEGQLHLVNPEVLRQ